MFNNRQPMLEATKQHAGADGGLQEGGDRGARLQHACASPPQPDLPCQRPAAPQSNFSVHFHVTWTRNINLASYANIC